MQYIATIQEIIDLEPLDSGVVPATRKEVLTLRFESPGIDIPAIAKMLTTPARKPRADRGTKRTPEAAK